MLAASRPARSLVLPMKPVFMHGPGSCAGVLGDGGGPGGRESIPFRRVPFLHGSGRLAQPDREYCIGSAGGQQQPDRQWRGDRIRIAAGRVMIAHHADTTTTQSGTTATDNSGSYYFIRRAPDQFCNDAKSPTLKLTGQESRMVVRPDLS